MLFILIDTIVVVCVRAYVPVCTCVWLLWKLSSACRMPRLWSIMLWHVIIWKWDWTFFLEYIIQRIPWAVFEDCVNRKATTSVCTYCLTFNYLSWYLDSTIPCQGSGALDRSRLNLSHSHHYCSCTYTSDKPLTSDVPDVRWIFMTNKTCSMIGLTLSAYD